ncbi:hypothetical protein CHUAL_009559 [Chamberlinius hualienensis]
MAKNSKLVSWVLSIVCLLGGWRLLGLSIHIWSILLAVIIAYALTTDGFFEWLYVTFRTLPRDYQAAKGVIGFTYDLYKFRKAKGGIPARFKQQLQKHPNKTCFIADGRKWSFKEVDDFSESIAVVFNAAGFVHGDVVALYMESKPEFVCIWLGLAKIGVVSALINYNLRLQLLTHSITAAQSKALIFSSSLADAVVEMKDTLPNDFKYYAYGEKQDNLPFAKSINDEMQRQKSKKAPKVDIKPEDRMVYIYTSGTTGLPKAAVISNVRYFFMTSAPHHMMRFCNDDIIYEPLPVYHSAGGIMGVGQALCYGLTVIIKKRFSASQFWDDCIRDNATVSEYLGETCRYLLAQPSKPQDTAHSIRMMFGSGLRPQIWKNFVDRFSIKEIFELYGSTEGNANIVNTDSTLGAVGFLPRSVPRFLPCTLIKVDDITGAPIRDEDGMCIECKPGEPGELVGKIIANDPMRKFDGYVNKEATSKKIIKNVFQNDDIAFSSGDILVMDRWGYLYFRDRTGDTFRWKGENVSTSEVEAVISNNINLNDCVVYGVEVPNCEGRAGMVAILDESSTVNLDKLIGALIKELPSYARPLFIRITDTLPMTGTFKLKKLDLQNDGFNPSKVDKNKLYYSTGSKYEILTPEVYEDICTEGFFEWFYVAYKTYPRDFHGAIVFAKCQLDVYKFRKNEKSIAKRFRNLVEKHPYKTCFISETGKKWTYKDVDDISDRVACVFHQAGYGHGDIVALFMDSTPDFVCLWLGLAKLGVISAFINYNLRRQSLSHTVNSVFSKAIIFGSNLGDAVVDVMDSMTTEMKYYYFGKDGDGHFPFAKSLQAEIDQISKPKPPKVDIRPEDSIIYVYTSGTTGLPKAAVITNIRYFYMSAGPHRVMGFREDDIMYTGLPLYHSMAGVMAVGQAICYGVTLVVRKKFSASQFWDDCIKYKCTATQYLGEICRYLLAQVPKPQDKAHSIRLMVGNGLRPKIWAAFVQRFGIENIVEFYSSTEGNASIINYDNTPGAVGFLSRIASFAYPCSLIRVNEKTGSPIRDENGLCIECKAHEPGELVGKIIKGDPTRNFDGYVNKEATSKKIIKDVFKKGDMAFSSGDILVMDRWGYLYFRDRTGDTFRWKGENVSTSEVEAVISNNINLTDSVVYGVEVPNCEGKAGMAAILDPNSTVNLDKLAGALIKELPSYARPLFIRITDTLPMTGTFKLKKLELQSDGFNPAKCGNHFLYYINGSTYSIMTQQIYDDICSGKIRM